MRVIKWKKIGLTVVWTLSFVGDVTADSYEDGTAAYSRADYTAVAQWLRKAAEQGYAGAQTSLGAMYLVGQGVPQDNAAAARWIRKAAEQGYDEAQYGLSRMYDKGQGVPQNYATAARWYRKAAEQGHADAQFSLSVKYALGQCVPQDFVETYKWANLAATSGVVAEAIKIRSMTIKMMTPNQVAKSQRLTREWRPRKSQQKLRLYPK